MASENTSSRGGDAAARSNDLAVGSINSNDNDITTATQPADNFDWRRYLEVHPAADLFPLMPEAELKELAEDIQAHGLETEIITWSSLDGMSGPLLLDGRNRLDALALLGLLDETPDHNIGLRSWSPKAAKWLDRSGDRIRFRLIPGGDPYAIALALNVHRRHLTNEQKRDLIARVLKAKPEVSNRQIAAELKVDHHKVAEVRRSGEATGEISPVQKTTGKDGKARRVRPRPKKVETTTTDAAELTVEVEKRADKPAHKSVASKDTALREFDSHLLGLLQMISKAKPERFAKTGVSSSDLSKLGDFLACLVGAIVVAEAAP